MSPVPDLGQTQAAALTPRRRGAAERAPAPVPTAPVAEQQTPVLLRLPDLYPSTIADAAVRRLERQVGAKKPAVPPESVAPRGEQPVGEVRTSFAPKPRMSAAEWNNRIIVMTFVFTLIAGSYMVIQRAARDRADAERSRLPVSSINDFDPVPSQRIDRGSFQADARQTDLGAVPQKHVQHGAGTASRIESFAETNPQYPAATVSYEAVVDQQVPPQPHTVLQNTYDLHGTDSQTGLDPYRPRSVRLRGESE